MKKIYNLICMALLGVLTLASCHPDDYGTVDPNGIPDVNNYEAQIVVDQETNIVTFALGGGATGVLPIWLINGKTYTTVNGYQKFFEVAGDYTVEMKVMNRNGISDGSKQYTFHVNNTMYDFDKLRTIITGGTTASSKEWRMKNEEAGHFGCGESGTDGSNWWSAAADDKKGVGIYDNRIVLGTNDGVDSYTFNPGESGTMYVNCGVSGLWPSYEDASVDYNVPATVQTENISWEIEGKDLYMVLPSHTQFLYVPYADSWENPRFRVESYSTSDITLISDNGSIAWRYVLTSKEGATTFNGYKYNSEFNIWKPIDDKQDYTTSFWYAPGWAQIADPGFAQNGSTYTFTLPQATTDQWQAQCFIIPNSLQLSSSINYDFSCIINSSTDIDGVTLKLVDKNDDGNFLFAERVPVKAYEDYIFYLTDLPGIDADCKLVLDFGGNKDNCVVTVKNIVLKDHANDDGTVLPSDDPEPSVDWREADNILKGMTGTYFYYYAPGWAQIADPEMTEKDGAYTLTLPEATTDQWQAQFHVKNTGISLSADKTYDFRCKVSSNNDLPGVTLKICEDADDGILILNERPAVKAYDDSYIEYTNLTGADIADLKFVLDFGGNPANTVVTVSDILLQEHKKSADEMTWDAESANNMWTADMIPNWAYYAPGWSQIADPVITQSGRTFTISLPTATTDQWQAQVACKETGVSTSASDSYDFQALLTSNKDLKGVTVKLVLDGDDNTFYFADRVDLTAFETYTFRKAGMAGIDMDKVNLFFDFGGNPDDTEVEVSNIILRKAGAEAKRPLKSRRR